MFLASELAQQIENGWYTKADVGKDEVIVELIGHIIEECVEARQTIGSRKKWRQNPTPTDRNALLSELVDVYKFLSVTLALAGFSTEEFYEAVQKNEDKIRQRLKNNY